MNNLSSHIPSLRYRKEIKDICDPLNKLSISYFAHTRLDKNEKFSIICNNPEFMDVYHQKKYFNIDIHTADIDKFGNYVIWDDVPRDGKTLQMGKDAMTLKIQHTFTIIERTKNGTDFFHFSTHVNNDMMNQLYLANVGLLRVFIDYFKKRVSQSKHLATAHDVKISLDEDAAYILKPDTKIITSEDRDVFLNQLAVDSSQKIDILNPLAVSQAALSKREIEIIQFVSKGYSSKEIARLLFISHRTVEHHIENIKNKYGVKSRAELVKIGVSYLGS